VIHPIQGDANGDLPAGAVPADSELYQGALVEAVKRFQDPARPAIVLNLPEGRTPSFGQ
jgi:hypothetical protein